jgi:acetylornithine deacetylase
MDTVSYLQNKFYEFFPRHNQEDVYNFITQSSLKPTRISSSTGATNIIPGECMIEGDIRLAPFYDVETARQQMEKWVLEINNNPHILLPFVDGSAGNGTSTTIIHRGPLSKYILSHEEELKGKIHLTWTARGENGVAVNLQSPGYNALRDATQEIIGSVVPYGIGAYEIVFIYYYYCYHYYCYCYHCYYYYYYYC